MQTNCQFIINTLRPRQNGRHFADDIFKCIFLNENVSIVVKISLKFVQLTIFQHWFRWWLGAVQATSHYLNQWWLVYWRIYASLGLNELTTFFKRPVHNCGSVVLLETNWHMVEMWICFLNGTRKIIKCHQNCFVWLSPCVGKPPVRQIGHWEG